MPFKLPKAGKKCVRRVARPSSMDPKSFRWIQTKKKKGALLVACPKGKWRGGRCSAGTRLVEIVLKRKAGKRCEKGYVSA